MKNGKGITLVALIITIIVLLILAVVSINLVINSGIITKTKSAVDKYSEEEIGEQIKLAYSEWQMAQFTGNTQEVKDFIKNKLDAIFNNVEEVLVDNGKISVTITEGEQVYSYNYDISTGTTNKSYKDYVGYYADIDADGTVDGVIFADLLVGNTKGTRWLNNPYYSYSIPTINKDALKNYYISKKSHNGAFGIKDVLSPQNGTQGQDRFYIMSLEDFTASSYTKFYWYKNAKGNMDDFKTATSTDFGAGKTNTINMISKWNSSAYGTGENQDLWKHIQTKNSEGWFLPSIEELAAFANELGITKDNYNSYYNLNSHHWSSSQENINNAWYLRFNDNGIYPNDVSHLPFVVRLATTF